jgi:hypothetical protein
MRATLKGVRQCSRKPFHRDFRTGIGRKGGKRASHSVDQQETLKTAILAFIRKARSARTVIDFSCRIALGVPIDHDCLATIYNWHKDETSVIRFSFLPYCFRSMRAFAALQRDTVLGNNVDERGIIEDQLLVRCRARRNRRKYRGADRRMRNSSRLSNDRTYKPSCNV